MKWNPRLAAANRGIWKASELQRCDSPLLLAATRCAIGLAEALATGADPLHLALVFNIDHTNAMAYANAARSLLSGPSLETRDRHAHTEWSPSSAALAAPSGRATKGG